MNDFYIYIRDMCDAGKVYKRNNAGRLAPVIISAADAAAALEKYFTLENMPDCEKWLYFAKAVKKADDDDAKLAATGFTSWEDYYNDMYPERPIEL